MKAHSSCHTRWTPGHIRSSGSRSSPSIRSRIGYITQAPSRGLSSCRSHTRPPRIRGPERSGRGCLRHRMRPVGRREPGKSKCGSSLSANTRSSSTRGLRPPGSREDYPAELAHPFDACTRPPSSTTWRGGSITPLRDRGRLMRQLTSCPP